MSIVTLTDPSEFDAALSAHERLWVFKHSAICPTSHAAHDEFQKHMAANSDIPAVLVVVQDARPVSNHIAEVLGRVHQSPQVFLVAGGKPVWDASHWAITDQALTDARGRLTTS